MSEALQELGATIALKRADAVQATAVAFGELTVTANLAHLESLVEFLRDDASCRFSTLVDITAVDHPERVERFDVVYHFLSMYRNQRIRVKVAVREDEMVPSLDRPVPGRQLVRARNLRHVRHPVQRPPGPAPHPDRLRLPRPSLAQGFPDHRLCRGPL
jgi:Ni,Fe-hydrogenase III component G